jgi:ABC-2 type transport system permease protein
MNRPIIQLIFIQFREFFREPGSIFWSIFFPIIMAWGLGMAFNGKGETRHNIAIINNENEINVNFRKLLVPQKDPSKFTLTISNDKTGTSKYFFTRVNWNNAVLMVKRGEAAMIIEEKTGALIYHFDPQNAEANLCNLQLEQYVTHKGLTLASTNIQTMTVVGTRYIDFLVPGLIAMGIMTSVMWGICYSLIDNRNKKLMRRLVATPMKKSSFLFSIIFARVILSFIEAAILYIFVHWYFHISIQGSMFALLAMLIAGNFAFSGIAILAASRTSNTYFGNGLINIVVLPMMLLSGVYFSYHNFPESIIPYIQMLPLTMLADSIRSIFIEGAGFTQVYVPMLSLCGIGVVFFIFGLKIFKWY